MCGHVYDPAKGEAKKYTILLTGVGETGSAQADGQFVKPGTDFSALPADWKCPVCGVNKSYFRKQMPERLASMRTMA
jgi:rubredoxin